tara:strand:+ start:25 stop:207 length:183 start_codon:yes stop_codon:yes gene_type:complete
MAASKSKPSTVKVQAIYDGVIYDSMSLWGVPFNLEGEVYIAEVSSELAKELIDAGRVTKL